MVFAIFLAIHFFFSSFVMCDCVEMKLLSHFCKNTTSLDFECLWCTYKKRERDRVRAQTKLTPLRKNLKYPKNVRFVWNAVHSHKGLLLINLYLSIGSLIFNPRSMEKKGEKG